MTPTTRTAPSTNPYPPTSQPRGIPSADLSGIQSELSHLKEDVAEIKDKVDSPHYGILSLKAHFERLEESVEGALGEMKQIKWVGIAAVLGLIVERLFV